MQAKQLGVAQRLFMNHQLNRHAWAACAVSNPVGDLISRIDCVKDKVDVGAGVRQTNGCIRVLNHLLHNTETAIDEICA